MRPRLAVIAVCGALTLGGTALTAAPALASEHPRGEHQHATGHRRGGRHAVASDKRRHATPKPDRSSHHGGDG